ncbi:hypothetical protein ACET5B_32825, partial [Pseudomonas aeruginosa]
RAKGMVHKGKSPTRKGLPEGRKGCVRAGEHEKATGEHPPAGAQWLSLAQFLPGKAQDGPVSNFVFGA